VKLCGVGEIGLDLYWSEEFYHQQREVLHANLRWHFNTTCPL
jgi:Tat protein secretion system quality control protein TatD with DNase activity